MTINSQRLGIDFISLCQTISFCMTPVDMLMSPWTVTFMWTVITTLPVCQEQQLSTSKQKPQVMLSAEGHNSSPVASRKCNKKTFRWCGLWKGLIDVVKKHIPFVAFISNWSSPAYSVGRDCTPWRVPSRVKTSFEFLAYTNPSLVRNVVT